MLREQLFRKVISVLMLIAFCAATIIFQNINLKNYYSVMAKKGSLAQSFNGQLGLLEEETQSSAPNTLMEEEDDDIATEDILFVSQRFELLTLQYVTLQEQLFREHHPEIVSPPPRG